MRIVKSIGALFLTLCLTVAGLAYADNSAVNRLMGLGIPDKAATQIDAEFASAVQQSVIPATPSAFNVGSAASPWAGVYTNTVNLPFVVATPAATPVAGTNQGTTLTVIPTAAANAGVYLPVATPGVPVMFQNSNGTNSVNVYPRANALTTPAAINAVAAGTPVALAATKTLICFAASTTQWYCTWGQGS